MNPNNNMSPSPVGENNNVIRTRESVDWDAISTNRDAIIITSSIPIGITLYEQTSEHDTFYCSIKLDEIQNGEFVMIINNCQHRFHAESLRGWLQRKNNCPLCRGSLVDTP
jgi:hypothetical protein